MLQLWKNTNYTHLRLAYSICNFWVIIKTLIAESTTLTFRAGIMKITNFLAFQNASYLDQITNLF
jgi:hypothetical protein